MLNDMTKPIYRFVSKWKIRAPLPAVRTALRRAEDWPKWWSSVAVSQPVEGRDNPTYDTKWQAGAYSLAFRAEVYKDTDTEMAYTAQGDLVGEGKMTFHTDTAQPEYTIVVITWEVVPSKRWMRWLTPLLVNAFRSNHADMMAAGEQGLQRYLQMKI